MCRHAAGDSARVGTRWFTSYQVVVVGAAAQHVDGLTGRGSLLYRGSRPNFNADFIEFQGGNPRLEPWEEADTVELIDTPIANRLPNDNE